LEEKKMAIHDWTRVDAGIFHSFHNTWIGEMTIALNSGLLPPEFYALGEQIAGGLGPDILTLRLPEGEGNGTSYDFSGAVAVVDAPPKVRSIVRTEMDDYTLKQRSMVIRHSSNHRIVALIEILFQGNKASRHAFRSLLEKVLAALAHGIHLLLIDLHPPTLRDPDGIHGAIWKELTGDLQEHSTEKPLTLVAYSAGPVKTAYIEPIAVGDILPEMPLFLTSEQYINVPLEATYQAAYEGVPRFYREILERR
jgi:hypothetical protein